MNLYLYTVKGDPQQLAETWRRVVEELGKEELFLNVAATDAEGMTFVDICPTDADFQGWIEGDDWRRIKAELGGEVEVRKLGQVSTAVARDTVVDVVHARAHA